MSVPGDTSLPCSREQAAILRSMLDAFLAEPANPKNAPPPSGASGAADARASAPGSQLVSAASSGQSEGSAPVPAAARDPKETPLNGDPSSVSSAGAQQPLVGRKRSLEPAPGDEEEIEEGGEPRHEGAAGEERDVPAAASRRLTGIPQEILARIGAGPGFFHQQMDAAEIQELFRGAPTLPDTASRPAFTKDPAFPHAASSAEKLKLSGKDALIITAKSLEIMPLLAAQWAIASAALAGYDEDPAAKKAADALEIMAKLIQAHNAKAANFALAVIMANGDKSVYTRALEGLAVSASTPSLADGARLEALKRVATTAEQVKDVTKGLVPAAAGRRGRNGRFFRGRASNRGSGSRRPFQDPSASRYPKQRDYPDDQHQADSRGSSDRGYLKRGRGRGRGQGRGQGHGQDPK
jgi:hypothetical protein